MTYSLRRFGAAISRRGPLLAAWWETQPWPIRLYSAGGIVLLVSIALAVLGVTFRDLPQKGFTLGAGLLASGIVFEGYRLADKALATRLGKVLAALAATMVGALSMGISSVLINLATGFPPNEFSYAVAFLAPLTAGYLILLTTIALFVVAPITILATGVASLWQSRHRSQRETDGDVMRMGIRLVAAITLLTLVIFGWNKQHKPYEDSLVSLAGWFVYTFEMYGNDVCAEREGERVRRIGANTVLVGHTQDGRRSFFSRSCEPSTID